MDSLLRVLKYSVSICIKIESAVPADRPQTEHYSRLDRIFRLFRSFIR